MTSEDKKLLVAKIDTLYYSIDDVRLQSILTLLRDTVSSIKITEGKGMGFTADKES